MRRFLARQVSSHAARLARRTRTRGFTLPELMVSLVAGLIVTAAVMGLARTATNTFHEQVRSTSSQMALRLAGQRLANDLTRASYMSTGNIRWDPGIARESSGANLSGSRYISLENLAGIRLFMAGSAQDPELTLNTDNGLRPQAIDITGNMTSNDQYIAQFLSQGGCPPTTLQLNANDSAVLKIVTSIQPNGTTPARSDADATALLRSIFLPVAGARFAARVTDPGGKTHFVIVNNATVVGGVANISFANPTSGPAGCPVLEPKTVAGGQGGVNGFVTVQIAPVHTVRWSIRRIPSARLDPTEDAAAKFDLVRQYIDADNLPAGTPEVVAEYAVDLKFAFTVDQSPTAPNITSFDFEDQTSNGNWAATPTNGVAASARNTPSDPAPHRIRSIRFRISDRAARPDREFDMAGQPGYPFRYCLDGPPSLTCVRYARIRTITSEVALINQARMKSIASESLPAY